MNKKLFKALSVFIMAGAIGAGTAGLAACKTNNSDDSGDTHQHVAGTTYESDATNHWNLCTAGDNEKMNVTAHADSDSDGKCDVCGYQMTTVSEGFVLDEGTTGLQVEGLTTTYDLSTTLTSATVDLTKLKVYCDIQGTKGKEVPAANYTATLYNGTTALESMSGLKKDGTYTLVVAVKDAKTSTGATATTKKQITITVNNAFTSIELKEGTTTQVQGTDAISSGWTFKGTRANGDVEDIATSDITIGTMDTNTAGDHTVTISLNGTSVTGTVAYTITADESKVSQSYALNFGYLTTAQETSIKNGEAVSLQDGRFVVQSVNGGEVASHGKTYGTKYFAKRLKMNGDSTSYDSTNSRVNSRYIKVHADGAGTITVIAYNNSGSVGDSGSRNIGLYSTRTVTEGAADAYSGQIGSTAQIPSKEHYTATFTVTEAGDYYIICEKAMTFCYVQLDQLVAAGTGVTQVTLGGETVVSAIEVTAPETVSNFKVGATFSYTGYTVKATNVNNVTCEATETDVTASAVFTAPDMTTIGEKTVTVAYGGAEATYKIIVETAVDGIYGATAVMNSSLVTETAEGSTILIKKSDIVISLVGTNANASTTYKVTYGADNTELTEDGAQFGIGTTTFTVVITVTADTQTDTITTTVDVVITKKTDNLTVLNTYELSVSNATLSNTTQFKWGNTTTLETEAMKFGSNSDTLTITLTDLKAGQQIILAINVASGSDKTVTVDATTTNLTGSLDSHTLVKNSYIDVSGTFTVVADGTATIVLKRAGGGTIRIKTVKVTVKGEANTASVADMDMLPNKEYDV